ncbi:MAG: tRNA 2-thiocytidine(32) synthetase TtcA [Lachnospiraceae bacterium]|nr:tRNA 2-thiocytidine(32) synthetase TtcA [Lachnospiraceae bacterium]
MELQKLYSYLRRGIDDYHMITSGDKIAVGISGGKDSLALLYGLAGLKRFYPLPFELVAITVDVGFEGMNFKPIAELCKKLEVPYEIVTTDIKEIVFDVRKESNPCSLCSKMRKGALNNRAKELGCNKIAYAHHKDDAVETLMMSLIYEGRIHSFSPVTYLDKMDLTLIRPMIYVCESEVVGFKNKYNLPVVKSTCEADGNTKREYVKHLLADINKETGGVKNRMFTALVTDHISGFGVLKEDSHER